MEDGRNLLRSGVKSLKRPGMKNLFFLSALLFAGCIATPPQKNVYEVHSAGGDATRLIQEKLDSCFIGGGGKVVLNEGRYNVGGLRLRSNTTLYLKSGAAIIGSRNCEDYDILYKDSLERIDVEDSCGRDVVWIRPKLRKDGKASHITYAGSRWNDAIIRLYRAENAAIIGEPGSLIDGCNSFEPETLRNCPDHRTTG